MYLLPEYFMELTDLIKDLWYTRVNIQLSNELEILSQLLKCTKSIYTLKTVVI